MEEALPQTAHFPAALCCAGYLPCVFKAVRFLLLGLWGLLVCLLIEIPPQEPLSYMTLTDTYIQKVWKPSAPNYLCQLVGF